MPHRTQPEAGAPWTAEHVRIRLVDAFSTLPAHGIRSSYSGDYGNVAMGHDPDSPSERAAGAFNWTTIYLGHRSDDRFFLLTWARLKAQGISNERIAQYFGKSEVSVKRDVTRLCRALAHHLNRDRKRSEGEGD